MQKNGDAGQRNLKQSLAISQYVTSYLNSSFLFSEKHCSHRFPSRKHWNASQQCSQMTSMAERADAAGQAHGCMHLSFSLVPRCTETLCADNQRKPHRMVCWPAYNPQGQRPQRQLHKNTSRHFPWLLLSGTCLDTKELRTLCE